MVVVYVAGPYRAPDKPGVCHNVRRAVTVAQELVRLGYAVICPHSMTHGWENNAALTDAMFLDSTRALVSRCDALLLVGDWQQSEGSLGERAEAVAEDIPVFDKLEDLLHALPPKRSA